jgi:hypothetical protein
MTILRSPDGLTTTGPTSFMTERNEHEVRWACAPGLSMTAKEGM